MAESARAQGKAPGDKGGQIGGEIRGKGKQRELGGRERSLVDLLLSIV